MSMLNIKIKCLPSWPASAGTSLMIRLPSQVPRPYWLTMYLFFWNLEGMDSWLIWCSWFWQDIKLCWNPCFSGAVLWSGYLRSCLPGYSPQFGSNKTLFYSYYRFFYWLFSSTQEMEFWLVLFVCLFLPEPWLIDFFFFSYFLKNFYWSITGLQCCVSFCCTAKWISYTYTYIHSFLDFFPHIGHYRVLSRVPHAIQ